jgi:serine/threonine-protein kinase RsbW
MPVAGITLAADAAQLPALQGWLQDCWHVHGLAPAESFAFELALEEVFMNVAMHGTPAGSVVPQVECRLAVAADAIELVVEDDGPAFDPLQQATPDLEAALEDRPVGGLGIHLLRQMMDEVAYLRAGQRNRLTMRKYRS